MLFVDCSCDVKLLSNHFLLFASCVGLTIEQLILTR